MSKPGEIVVEMAAERSSEDHRFWSRSGGLLLTQALVQGVNLGSNVLAVGILPAREVGVISLQTAIAAALYFTHAGSLNHLFNELPRLGGGALAAQRETMLRGALGVLLAVSLPLTLLGCLPFALLFAHELDGGARLIEFFGTTVLSVIGAQWTQAKECDIKSRGEPAALARWNLLLATTSALPLLLLLALPAYHVLLFRGPLGQALVALLVLLRGERAVFRPLLHEVRAYLKGGFHLVICQALSVLILQGERMLLAHRAGVEAVGEMQLYFLLQTGVQLIPATATNLWFPRARREPTPGLLRSSMSGALRFSFVALGAIALGGLIGGGGLQQGWAGEPFRIAASGLLIGCVIVPAHAFGSLLFVFMARDRVPHFVGLQFAVLVLQTLLYAFCPADWSMQTLILARGAVLYVALVACFVAATQVARRPADER